MGQWKRSAALVVLSSSWVTVAVSSCATSRDESLASNGGASGSSGDGGVDSSTGGDASVPPDGGWPEGQAPESGGTGGDGGSGGVGGTGGDGGTGGVGGAGGAGGTGGCTAQCAGKECGPDQCGGSCSPGCGANESCDGQGQCQSNCTDTWIVTPADSIYGVALASGGDLYAVGTKGTEAWVGALSPCNGSTAAFRQVAVPGATATYGVGIALSGSDVYIVGSTVTSADPQNGMWARLSAAGLSLSWVNPLYGSPGLDELWGIAAPSNGSFWMAGTSDALGVSRSWGIKGESGGQACGFPILGNASSGRNVLASGADVYMVGRDATGVMVSRFDASACTATGPCPCDPVWQSPAIQIASFASEARGIALAGGSLYLSGFAVETAGSNDYVAFVARVELNGGTLTGVWTWNPTSAFDGLADITTDGQRLYAVGLQGWDGSASFSSATAMAVALPFNISSSSSSLWYAELPSMDLAYRVAVDTSGQGGLYLGGLGGALGYVARCTTAGACP